MLHISFLGTRLSAQKYETNLEQEAPVDNSEKQAFKALGTLGNQDR